MKKITTKVVASVRRLSLPLMVLCAVVSLLPSYQVFANANQFLLTSSTAPANQIPIGTPFTVDIKVYIDTNTSSTQTATGKITYPAGNLKMNGTSASGGGFGNPTITPSSGAITFSASRRSQETGVVKIFTATFQATTAGTAVIGFDGDPKINNLSAGYKSVVIKIINPNPPASPSPSPSTSTQPSPKPSTSVKPITPSPSPSTQTPSSTEPEQTDEAIVVATPDPTGLVTDVNVTPTYTGGTVTWKVNAPGPKSTFTYGAKSSSLDQQAAATPGADGTFTATLTGLSPGKRYYFTISGTGDGDKSGTYSSAVITNGYPVTITVTENDSPAQSAQVQVGNLTKSTSSNGKVTIGLAEGSYDVKITTEIASLAATLAVAKKTIPTDGSAPESQAFAYNLTSASLEQGPGGSGTSLLLFIGVLIGGSALIGVGFVGFMAYRRNKYDMGYGNSSSHSGPTVVIDDGYNWRQEAATPPTPMPPQAPPTAPNSSVPFDDEEPADMFDKNGPTTGSSQT